MVQKDCNNGEGHCNVAEVGEGCGYKQITVELVYFQEEFKYLYTLL